MEKQQDRTRRLYLIDGMPLVYRAYFAFLHNPLVTSNGFNSSAVYGFTTSLLQILNDERPTHVAVVFDAHGDTWRNREYSLYKANRQKTPEDIINSLPYVSRITRAIGIVTITHDGVEADDVIGTLASRAEKVGFDTFLVTPDKDFAQLVTNHTFLYRIPASGRSSPVIYTPAMVCERFGIERPEQVIDLIGLAGDSVDNIPGIPGIGEKTAQKLIARFGSVEALTSNINQLRGKQQDNVKTYASQALLSKRLATIDRAVDLTVDIDKLVTPEIVPEQVIPVFQELEFNNLIERTFSSSDIIAAKFSTTNEVSSASRSLGDFPYDYRVANDIAKLVGTLISQETVSLFVVCAKGDAKYANIAGIAFCWTVGVAAYVALPDEQALATSLLKELNPFWNSCSITKIGHDLKRGLTALRWHGITVHGKLIDTRLAHQLLEPERGHDLESLAEHYLNYTLLGSKNGAAPRREKAPHLIARELVTDSLKLREIAAFAGERADVVSKLSVVLQQEVSLSNQLEVWERIEIPLMPLLVEMEYRGVRLKVSALRKYSAELEQEMTALESILYGLAGVEFNLNSPKQLGEVLFDHLKVSDKPKRTRTGQYMTAEPELTKLADRHPIIPSILEYRALHKLKSTYVEALPDAVSSRTGRIHSTFNQLATTTGRLSSESPNLQNIPIRSERGREIRRAFVPLHEKHVLLSSDYSQIELRIMAFITKDEGLVEAFKNNLDVHTATAARVFEVTLAGVTSEMRRRAKMINFGLMYGMSAFGLSQRLNITRTEAGEIIERYFAQFPEIKQYMEDTILFAREHGYVQTLCGRRRHLRDIRSGNHSTRTAAERMAINAPIQGTAADMIKIAMIAIGDMLYDKGLHTKMVLQVHDELVFDVPPRELQQARQIIKVGMRDALDLGTVPVVVHMGAGKDWLEAH